MNRLFRARLTLDWPWLPMLAVSIGLTLVTAYLVRMRFAFHAWIMPDSAIGLLLLLLVLSRVSRHGGQVLHALKHACGEHHMLSLGDAPVPREAAEEPRAAVS